MRRSALVLLVLAACGPTSLPSPPQATARVDAILGGMADTTSATVFILDLRFDNGQASICSATLVSPRTLLTAAHCVDPSLKGATSVMVRATNKADANMLSMSDVTEVTAISRHPGWNPASQTSPDDLAMLLLAAAPTGVTPSPLVRSLPSGFTGQSIRLVGYGTTGSGNSDSAIRRAVTLPVSSVGANTFNFGASGSTGVCSGDSGGPSFFSTGGAEAVVGVHSRTNSGNCGAGSDIRVDTHLAFIDGFIAANDPPTCAGDGRCAANCTPADPDCPVGCEANGACVMGCPVRDPDCVCLSDGLCEASCPGGGVDPDCRCVANGACETGCPAGVVDPDCRCRADGTCEGDCPGGATDPDCTCEADAVCVAACPAAQPDPDCADCAANGLCAAASCPGGDEDCLFDGAGCTEASECVGKRCVADPRGFRFCSRACRTTADCQLDMVCSEGVCGSAEAASELVTGGCAAAPAGQSLALLALALAFRRRRTPFDALRLRVSSTRRGGPSRTARR